MTDATADKLAKVVPGSLRVGDLITTATHRGAVGRRGKIVERDSTGRARVLWWGSHTRWSSPSTLRKYYLLVRHSQG